MTTASSAPFAPAPQSPAPRTADPDVYPTVTMLMLMLGGFVLPVIGWVAGVVMLWAGTSWTTGQKWLGTLVWPAVVAVPLAFFGIAFLIGGSQGLFVTGLAIGAIAAVIILPWTFVRLLRAAR